MSFIFIAILALAAIGLIGLVALIAAIRGTLVSGSTLCRACGFDLAGLGSASACPECGASLSDPRARTQKRIRSRGLFSLGIVLTSIPLFIGVAAGTLAATKFNFDSIKPVWLLQAEALQGAPARSGAALAELNKRIRANSLTDGQLESLARAAAVLRRRTNSSAWSQGWSEILESARSAGKVSDVEWVDYVRYTIVPLDRHRRKMRQGTEVPFGLIVAGPQLGVSPGSGAQARVRYGLVDVRFDGKEFFLSDQLGSTTTLTGAGSSGTATSIKVEAPPGKAKLILTWRFEVLDPNTENVLGTWDLDFTDDVEFLGENANIIEVREDVSLAAKVRQSLQISPFQNRSGGYTQCMIDASNPPANIAFDVFGRVRSGSNLGALIPIGKISFLMGSNSSYGIGFESKELNADSIDVVLKPSVTAAEQNIEMDWMWTGPDIIFEDIKITAKSP
ncbi:MAG: hypothetical protein ACREJD_04780 [Phycisphaerales bacterium]